MPLELIINTMTDLEPTTALGSDPQVAEALAAYSADTIARIQEAFGAHDKDAVLHAGTLILNCPMGEGKGPMSLLELVENRDHDPRVAHASDIVLEGVQEERIEGVNVEPEDLIRTAFGKRSFVVDQETGGIARQKAADIIKLHSPQDSKKK